MDKDYENSGLGLLAFLYQCNQHYGNVLSEDDARIMNAAIDAEEASYDDPEVVDGAWKWAQSEVVRLGAGQLKARFGDLWLGIEAHRAMLQDIRWHKGLRVLHCQTRQWASKRERDVVREHIQRPNEPRVPKGYPNWYHSEDLDLTALEEDDGEDPDELRRKARDVENEHYNYDFMFAEHDPDSPWPAFVEGEEDAGDTYFKKKWSITELEKLRVHVVRQYYGFPDKKSDAVVEADATRAAKAAEDAIGKRAEEEVEKLEGRLRWNEEAQRWEPWMGEADMWATQYLYQIEERMKAEHEWNLPDFNDRNRMNKELKTRQGPANDLFVWRLVVVHLRRLRAMGVPVFVPVTDCFDMYTLVANVAHLIKYRRCIKWAKSIYKTAGLGSLGDQYRAKLLNRHFAHEHQDKRDTELGIARRMIRQAHVANYVQFMYAPWPEDPSNGYQSRPADVRGKDEVKGRQRPAEDIYRTEKYLTNPPMAPIMCTAPPRMGKSALSLLMASFAVKMGGVVQYGVAPNKIIPVADIQQKLAQLGWVQSWGMLESEIRVYSHDDAKSVAATNVLLQATANSLIGWTLHIRDEAQNLVRATGLKGGDVSLKEELHNTFPLFYGLSMCVSATLLPVMCLGAVTGNDESIRDLLDFGLAPDADTLTARPHWEQFVVLQPWSFPAAPDFLVPPRSAYPVTYPNGALLEDDKWYQDYYARMSNNAELERVPLERTTNYYGTWFYIEEASDQHGSPMYLREANAGVALDTSLAVAEAANARWLKRLFGMENGKAALRPMRAFEEYLKNFNRHSTQCFNERTGQRQSGAAPRVASWPIKCLTADAARMLYHAQTWLAEPPRACSAQVVDDDGDVTELPKRLYPMLIMAPRREQKGKNGRLEWAVLLCKLAWLRMHKDYVNKRLPLDIDPDDLARRYGLTVLVYSSDKKQAAYEYVVARPDDIKITNKDERVIAITFDPRLPENRFANYQFTHPRLSDEENQGRLLPSVFVPTLTPEIVRQYETAYEGQQASLTAYDYVRDNVRINLYRFDMTRCYPPCPEEVGQQASVPTHPDAGNDGGGGGGSSMQVDPPPQGDDDDGGAAAAAANASPSGGDESDSDESDTDSDADSVASDDPLNRGQFAGLAASFEPAVPLGLALAGGCSADAWNRVAPPPGAQWPTDPTRDDHVVGDCDPVDEDGDPDDDPDAPPGITDLNGIALRLCVHGFADAQKAAEASLKKCQIVKIAAVGYKMFDAGLTLQSTFKGAAPDLDAVHMFVPKYMSIAPNQAKGQRDLSLLYQLVGRGFVDMKANELPADWKLNLLATGGTRNLCKLYGNTELLLSQVRNESLEGRKLTLGTALRVIKAGGMQTYGEIAGHALRGRARAQDPSRNMWDCLSITGGVPEDDEHREIDRPFHNVRECLEGKYAPRRAPADVIGEEEAQHYPNVLEEQLTGEEKDELEYQGLSIVDVIDATWKLSIKDVDPGKCAEFPAVASTDGLVWRDRALSS